MWLSDCYMHWVILLVVDLKTIVKTNTFQDNPIPQSDIKLMEHLYGPNIPTVKGKMTR